MNDVVKSGITLLAAVAALVMIGVGLYGFTQNLPNWGGPLLAGMAAGFLTMCAAYNV